MQHLALSFTKAARALVALPAEQQAGIGAAAGEVVLAPGARQLVVMGISFLSRFAALPACAEDQR